MNFFDRKFTHILYTWLTTVFYVLRVASCDSFSGGDYSEEESIPRMASFPNMQYDAPVQQLVDVENTLSSLNFSPTYVPSWPKISDSLGQVSAVSLDSFGNVVLFHRGSRKWDAESFNKDEIFLQQNLGPIPENTILVLNSTTGDVSYEWGSHMFYMPHGLTVDYFNNIWITDVALHQVMKFSFNASTSTKPSLTLGKKFLPGNSLDRFCKPTSVAVMRSGDFFVADGYCNSRIMKFSMNGEYLTSWGKSTRNDDRKPPPYNFRIPHALALAEDKDMLCVADRENGRVQCFNAINGSYIEKFQHPIIGQRIFSVAYSSVNGGQLYVVNGPNWMPYYNSVRGFVINMTSGKIVSQFRAGSKDFQNPHDIAVSSDGKQAYVVEIDPYVIHKFEDNTLPNASVPTNFQLQTIESAKPTATVDKQSSVISAISFSDTAINKGPTATFLIIVTVLIILTAILLGIAALISRHLKRGRHNIDNVAEYSKLMTTVDDE
ncbi:peptidyl-alpha-hydroxyglycine alpha-amidating lyase 1-like [Ctenocephalides felis]|uniref:peptidyl-alpha-hydroxyglycine alpha-amidating lyase 1-like n=1 Tax=Ctenocephalides felis TaxID=7515 RepID=UPI000E6E59B0|nr:peptidyl-alpha-hydroxyglycine alpha-amidating lyase 1-like [Ctenocephalides felis]